MSTEYRKETPLIPTQFKPGHKMSPGKAPGIRAATTDLLRDRVLELTEGLVDHMPALFTELMERNPKEALDLAVRLLEYSIPKMSRQEIKGEVEHRINQISVNINRNNGISNTDNGNV